MNVPIDISEVTLRTSRLILRPWRLTDLDDMFAYASIDGVGQMAGWTPHATRADTREILKSFIAEKKTFALECDGKAVGSLGIERYDEERFPQLAERRCRELGFVLTPEYWGRGLMPEAVTEVTRYLFEEIALDAILCSHFQWNSQSARVQQKCGFVHYAYGTYLTSSGILEPDEMSILTRSRWLEMQSAL